MASEWRERPERGGRRITRFYMRLCIAAGRRMARPILYGIALYFFLSAPKERRASAAYLQRVTGRAPSLLQVYRHIFTFSTIIMDRLFFLARRLDSAFVPRTIVFVDKLPRNATGKITERAMKDLAARYLAGDAT